MPSRFRSPHPVHGFSLIELMVAVAIGMVSVLVMMQMLTNADTSKRITSGSSDAQVVGAIGIYSLERELRMGGYGLNSKRLIGCMLTHTTRNGQVVRFPLVPVLINPPSDQINIPPGDDNSDVLLIVHGDARESSDGDVLQSDTRADIYSVATVSSFRQGQFVVAQDAGATGGTFATPCTPIQSAKIMDIPAGSSDLTVKGGQAGKPQGSVLFNLGQISAKVYAVRRGMLTMCDFAEHDCTRAGDKDNEEIWVPVANNVVALRAQYGRDLTSAPLNGSGTAYTIVSPGAGPSDMTRTAQCVWARTLTVKVAIVARSAVYDKERVDSKKYVAPPAMPTWSGNAEAPIDLTKSVTGPGSDREWQKYRYKVFESNVPLRNSSFQGETC